MKFDTELLLLYAADTCWEDNKRRNTPVYRNISNPGVISIITYKSIGSAKLIDCNTKPKAKRFTSEKLGFPANHGGVHINDLNAPFGVRLLSGNDGKACAERVW